MAEFLDVDGAPLKKPVRTRMPAAERKAEIVNKAIELAAKVGPDRLTTEVLAREVGISQAAIFRHFANKGAIWEAVARRLSEKVRENWKSGGIEKNRQANPLKMLILNHLDTIQQTPALPAILFSRELHAENDKLRGFFVNMVEKFHALIATLIKEQMPADDTGSQISAEDAAWLVLSLIQGLALRWSLNSCNFDLVREGERLLDLQLMCFSSLQRENNK